MAGTPDFDSPDSVQGPPVLALPINFLQLYQKKLKVEGKQNFKNFNQSKKIKKIKLKSDPNVKRTQVIGGKKYLNLKLKKVDFIFYSIKSEHQPITSECRKKKKIKKLKKELEIEKVIF